MGAMVVSLLFPVVHCRRGFLGMGVIDLFLGVDIVMSRYNILFRGIDLSVTRYYTNCTTNRNLMQHCYPRYLQPTTSTPLLRNTILNTPQRTSLMRRINSDSIPRPPSRISPKHKLPITLRHNLNIPLHQESIIKHPRRLLRPMLHIPHLRVNPHLHLGILGIPALALFRLGVGHCGPEVQHTAHGHGVLEGAGVQSEEVGSGVGEGGGAAEG